jgi:hypothetical protein
VTSDALSRLLGLLLGCAVVSAACVQPAVPSIAPTIPSPTDARPSEPGSPESSSPEPAVAASADGRVAGPWLAAPIALGDPQIAVVSDACAVAAREKLGEAEANLPTVVIDARGGGYATAIFADDLMAIVCFARFGVDGSSATVDSVDRLTSRVLEPLDGGAVEVDAVVRLDDQAGDRTVAFGRVGPEASAIQLGLDDGQVAASVAEDRWAAWWPGMRPALGVSALSQTGVVVGSADAPVGELEARTEPAWWWLDPGAAAPTPASTRIAALLLERACASGRSPAGRIEPPEIEPTDTTIVVTFRVRHREGGQDCIGNLPFPITIRLPEPLGKRILLDGSENPPRDATKPA